MVITFHNFLSKVILRDLWFIIQYVNSNSFSRKSQNAYSVIHRSEKVAFVPQFCTFRFKSSGYNIFGGSILKILGRQLITIGEKNIGTEIIWLAKANQGYKGKGCWKEEVIKIKRCRKINIISLNSSSVLEKKCLISDFSETLKTKISFSIYFNHDRSCFI